MKPLLFTSLIHANALSVSSEVVRPWGEGFFCTELPLVGGKITEGNLRLCYPGLFCFVMQP